VQEYETALKFTSAILKAEPNNRQAQQLETFIQKKLRNGMQWLYVISHNHPISWLLLAKISQYVVYWHKNFWDRMWDNAAWVAAELPTTYIVFICNDCINVKMCLLVVRWVFLKKVMLLFFAREHKLYYDAAWKNFL